MLSSYLRKIKVLSGFSVLHWNILADGYFTKQSFPEVDYIPFKDRFKLLKSHLKTYDSTILCLPQCDMAQDFTQFLQTQGYLCYFNAVRTKTVKDTSYGIMVGIKLTKFTVNDYNHRYFIDDPDHQFWTLHLTDNETKKQVFVVCTHLKSKIPYHERRVKQMKEIIVAVRVFNEKNPEVPVVVMGDLNAEPEEQCMKDVFALEFKNGGRLMSSYDTKLWTTCKHRQTLELRTIDYILYNNLNVVSIEQPPSSDTVIKDRGLPNKLMPSDHLPLYAHFTFK